MTVTNQFAAHFGLDLADKNTVSVLSLKTVCANLM